MRLTLALCLCTAPALACNGEVILSCTAKGGTKAIEVCLADGAFTYAYGPAGGRPELTLREPLMNGTLFPWQGYGRDIAESVAFFHGAFRYDVAYSVDRLDETHPAEGSVTAFQDGTEVAHIRCDPGTVTLGLFAAQEAMEALGQCWDGPAERWTASCP